MRRSSVERQYNFRFPSPFAFLWFFFSSISPFTDICFLDHRPGVKVSRRERGEGRPQGDLPLCLVDAPTLLGSGCHSHSFHHIHPKTNSKSQNQLVWPVSVTSFLPSLLTYHISQFSYLNSQFSSLPMSFQSLIEWLTYSHDSLHNPLVTAISWE